MALLPNGIRVRIPQPEPRRYGLLEVAQPVTPQDNIWMVGGVNWEDFLCTNGVEVFLDNCPPATGYTKPAQRSSQFCTADPFNVVGSYDCSTGGRPVGEAFEIARQRLLKWEGHDVEEAFWTGVAANGDINPSLAFGNTECDIDVVDLTPGGGAVDPVSAISLLESALADTIPFAGVIHASHELPAYLASFHLLEREGNRLYTPLGTSYVFGSGYPGTGPANAAPGAGTTWVFATGPIGVWRSDVYMVPDEVPQAVDRMINDITVRAERTYAVAYSCSVLAINVDLTCACQNPPLKGIQMSSTFSVTVVTIISILAFILGFVIGYWWAGRGSK